jgi:molybdopterin converting factor subunit 1
MHVSVLYFGILKELLKRDGERIELPAESSVSTLLDRVRGGHMGAHEVWRSVAVAVNREYADVGRTLHEGDEVAMLPPVSGGSGRNMRDGNMRDGRDDD